MKILKTIIILILISIFIIGGYAFFTKKGPWCVVEVETCNSRDDDCDNEIDEDDVCVIVPRFNDAEAIIRPPREITTIDGVTVAHDHILVILEDDIIEAEFETLLEEIANLDLLVIGQSPGLNMLQLQSKTPDALASQRSQLTWLTGVWTAQFDTTY